MITHILRLTLQHLLEHVAVCVIQPARVNNVISALVIVVSSRFWDVARIVAHFLIKLRGLPSIQTMLVRGLRRLRYGLLI